MGKWVNRNEMGNRNVVIFKTNHIFSDIHF